ncbi:MAG TPA: serine hydrolase [Leptospiraceae bacterium]|nr:serine hydrolase [Spirochaetaceae bacterium]HBS06118.1 serine hydrolase [Leptospiraceae bacterium]|tara:strand:- start:3836 stop:5359 length:1524 start_codon:yes stop_codon:yes gene_type:complete
MHKEIDPVGECMKNWKILTSIGATLVVIVLLTVISMLAPIGSGYYAKYLCSQLFVSGRDDVEQIVEEEIRPTNPLFGMVSHELDSEKKTVRAVTLGVFSPTLAVYRPEVGCTLAVKITPDELMEQVQGLSFDRSSENKEWPLGNQASIADETSLALESLDLAKDLNPPVISTDGMNLNTRRLNQVLEWAFSEPEEGRRQTQAVVIVYRGRLIAEKYAEGFNKDTPVLGWSMSKTATATLAGMMVLDGKLDISLPADVPEWEDDPERSAITTNDLLHMSSGLDFSEVYQPFNDAPEMLYNSADMAGYAASQPLAYEPGSRWYYSSGDTNLVARILRDLSGGSLADVQRYARNRLFHELEMNTVYFEPDPSGTFVGSSYMYASARDWARLGLLLQQDGVWNGKRLLPEGWVEYLRTPAADSGGQYGAQLWLNAGRDNEELIPERRFKSLPKNMFYMSGYNGQNVIILPDEELIVVRLGVTHNRENWNIERLVVGTLEALGLREYAQPVN